LCSAGKFPSFHGILAVMFFLYIKLLRKRDPESGEKSSHKNTPLKSHLAPTAHTTTLRTEVILMEGKRNLAHSIHGMIRDGWMRIPFIYLSLFYSLARILQRVVGGASAVSKDKVLWCMIL
jgi:hypothetical protein